MAVYKDIKYNTPISNGGQEVLLQTLTANESATVSFTTNIDSSFKSYIVRFIQIHGETNDKHLTFQASTDGGGSYGTTITTNAYRTALKEDNSFTFFGAVTGNDINSGTGFKIINEGQGNDDDNSSSGQLELYSPSDTTFVKHWVCRIQNMNFQSPPQSVDYHTQGYFNTTSAINALQFKMSSGDIDAGTFKLYGIN